MRAPFPYFGGKRRAADLVWERFGDVKNYVEPFAGSLAVLLARPHDPGIETVNDADRLLSNFWRALAHDPEGVAHHADWPVNEADLHARHLWLVGRRETLTERLMGDPVWYDVKAAGWWVWGACAWIGSGWCSSGGPWVSVDGVFTDARTLEGEQRKGVWKPIPHLASGRGINRQIPHLASGQGINRIGTVWSHLEPVAARIRNVRVACGDWTRVLGPTATYRHGLTGVFLDPPYPQGAIDYAAGDRHVYQDVTAWALENGDNSKMRIAVCGYESDHVALEDAGWTCVPWKAAGGYGSQSDGAARQNKHRERIWFSPHCIDPEEAPEQNVLF